MVSRISVLVICVAGLTLSGAACGKKKSKPAAKAVSSTSIDAGQSAPTSSGGKVVQKLSLDERRKRLLAMATPTLRKQMLKKPEQIPQVPSKEIVPVSTGVVKVGTVTVFLKQRRIEVPGKVTLKPGEIIEYLAVGTHGKTHETVFTLDTTAVHFRLALTMAGIKPAALMSTAKPAPITQASSLDVFVRLSDKPKSPEIPAVEFTVDRKTNKPLEGGWQMTGIPQQQMYSAMNAQQLIATRYDSIAMVNATVDTGNPYGGANVGLAVGKRTPAVGTKVTLILVGRSSTNATPKKKTP